MITKNLHIKLTGDDHQYSLRKSHKKIVPRVGGIGIFLGIFIASLARDGIEKDIASNLTIGMLFCFLPIFLVALAEDISKKISVLFRFLICLITANAATFILEISIVRTDLIFVDYLLTSSYFSLIFTTFAIAGLVNSYNLIDGLNGLSSFCAGLALLAIAYLSYKLNNFEVLYITCLILSTLFGFLLFNFPKGLIFLGDSGAYLIGFLLAIISIYLSSKYDEISPWFFILINAYPITDTIFSILRRQFRRRSKSIMSADGNHMHTILYRRWFSSNSLKSIFSGNSIASIFVLPLPVMGVILGLLFWRNSFILITSYILFCISYLYMYKSLIKFRTPSLIKKLMIVMK